MPYKGTTSEIVKHIGDMYKSDFQQTPHDPGPPTPVGETHINVDMGDAGYDPVYPVKRGGPDGGPSGQREGNPHGHGYE